MKRVAIAVILLPAVLYLCDSISIHYKIAYKGSSAALGTVQFFPAAELKNGRIEVYYDSPQTEACTHSLFPQLGYPPCWYANRTTVHVIGPDARPMFLPDMRKKY